eukprot:TRINITY_DN24592_c0_g1_i1.p1 TRINITY_DN24592_c0_g1~~TRINITY_DN24592_c0_g1_i1.p1  ORF type:complete len:851 (-),score=130.31 TRINITY_DN24592_c0_g1_i1:41-2542(-)
MGLAGNHANGRPYNYITTQCGNVIRCGDPVHVYSKGEQRWVDAKVTELLRGKRVCVEYQSNGKRCRKSMCANDIFLVPMKDDTILEEADPDGFPRAGAPYFRPGAPAHPLVVDKVEDRAVSLTQLLSVDEDVRSSILAERWVDPFEQIGNSKNEQFGRSLKLENITLYTLEYYRILPQCAPTVKLCNMGKLSYGKGTHVEQPSSRQGCAIGEILDTNGADITVKVIRGRFSRTEKDGVTLRKSVCMTSSRFEVGLPEDTEPLESFSYMERISEEPQPAKIYCSHFWGDPVLNLIKCCKTHAKHHGYSPKSAYYWICAFANRQHELGVDMGTDPEDSSFVKAMLNSDGLILLLDRMAHPFSRIWCCFEIYSKVVGNLESKLRMLGQVQGDKYFDIASIDAKGQPQFLFNEMPSSLKFYQAPFDKKSPVDLKSKMEGEERFPLRVLCKGLTTCLEEGHATERIDKVRILNSMRHHEQLDDETVLNLPARELESLYGHANNALHGIFAVAAWVPAMKAKKLNDFDFASDEITDPTSRKRKIISLPKILAKDSEHRRFLMLSFAGAASQMTDDHLHELVQHLPSRIKYMNLQFDQCHLVEDRGLEFLAENMPQEVENLQLSFNQCVRVSDKGVNKLTQSLQETLLHLRLEFSEIRGLTNVTNDSVNSVLCCVCKGCPQLRHLEVDFSTNKLLDDGCFDVFKEKTEDGEHHALPQDLADLRMNFRNCEKINDRSIQSLSEAIPQSVEILKLDFSDCGDITKLQLQKFVASLPPHLIQLQADFTQCKSKWGGMLLQAKSRKQVDALKLSVSVANRSGSSCSLSGNSSTSSLESRTSSTV